MYSHRPQTGQKQKHKYKQTKNFYMKKQLPEWWKKYQKTSITIKSDENNQEVFKIDNDTYIYLGEELVDISEIKKDEKVTLDYDISPDKEKNCYMDRY